LFFVGEMRPENEQCSDWVEEALKCLILGLFKNTFAVG
jgi:hypothetical protein